MTITEFLLARIDEDEQRAGAAAQTLGAWAGDQTVGPDWIARPYDYNDAAMVTSARTNAHGDQIDLWDNEGAGSLSMRAAAALHVAAWDPARVLRECEAKRRLLESHPGSTTEDECPGCGAWLDGTWRTGADERCPVLVALAAIYSDHPDFDPSWVSA